MLQKQLDKLRYEANTNAALDELLTIYDAALIWFKDWDDTKPAKGTPERDLYDAIRDAMP